MGGELALIHGRGGPFTSQSGFPAPNRSCGRKIPANQSHRTGARDGCVCAVEIPLRRGAAGQISGQLRPSRDHAGDAALRKAGNYLFDGLHPDIGMNARPFVQQQNRSWADLSEHTGRDLGRIVQQTIAAADRPSNVNEVAPLEFTGEGQVLDSNRRAEELRLGTEAMQHRQRTIQLPLNTTP